MTQFPTSALPYVAQNATAPAYWNVGILWLLLATGDQTAESYSLMEQWCPKAYGDTLLVITPEESGKVKRIRNNGHVEIRPSSRTGNVADLSKPVSGFAEIVRI